MRLEKIGIFASIIALIFTITWSIFIYVASSADAFDAHIIGIWQYDYAYDSGNTKVKIFGTTEYFEANSYNFTGQMNLFIQDDIDSIELTYDVVLSGEWSQKGDILITKVVGMRTHPTEMIFNSIKISMEDIPASTVRSFPRMEDYIPIGITEKYKVRFLKSDSMELEALSPEGGSLTILGVKKYKRFHPTDRL